jgi:DMSO/TMAO reductase YedYZ molybdopterin-dependent catalytic subunit
MRAWDRRGFLKIIGVSTALSFLSKKTEAGIFFLKKLLGRPPRETKPITPNNEFYVYHYAESAYLLVRDLNIEHWSLQLTGKVRRSISLTYSKLREKTTTTITSTIECIENPVGGDSIGNAVWSGIPLKQLLNEAGVLPGTKDVVFKAADGYTDSIPIERALEGNVLLAHEMNGVPLPPEHGYPLRAVVPGIYGMKNVKWITGIELVDYDHQGYWQQRGWSDAAFVRLTSRIDSPGHYQELSEGTHLVRGIAYAGDHGIRSVEVSTDGGVTWRTAELSPPRSPHSWVIWKYKWSTSGPGVYRLIVRATDQSGRLQESKITQAFPNGPTGLHAAVVHVVRS